MKIHNTAADHAKGGFTAVELLLVLTLAAVVLGGAVIGFGTLTRSQPRVATVVTVPLDTATLNNFFGTTDTKLQETLSAPHYGMSAQAEEMREQFNNDVISATAVYCLYRTGINNYRPYSIAYDPTVHGELDTPQKFRQHLITIGAVTSAQYVDYRNPLNSTATTPANNASIFILGYSKVVNQLKVLAIYEIDVIRYTDVNPAKLNGFHASVKRFKDDSRGSSYPLAYTGSYQVFYPPSVPGFTKPADWASDGFTPIFISFERASRLAWLEGVAIDRFKVAAERPFYFIWWPDPGARNLGPQANSLASKDPRQAYNHMAGRTAFMFTVPMFPAL